MKKNYIFKLLFVVMLSVSLSSYAQSNDGVVKKDLTENIEGLNIFPNPVINQLHISMKGNIRSVEILDMSGRLVLNSNKNLKTLDVSNLSSGIYFLNVVGDGQVMTKKFMKE